jgi:3-hydroxyisobutyrate dehydrogenase-like beta-hydroxyacid dehydrogenase
VSAPAGRPAIGWIGLGDQGLPMAAAIAEAGFPLHTWARRPGSLDALAAVAHSRHDDLADLTAACDIVGLCVSTDNDVLDLVTDGLLGHLAADSVVVNHGTGTPGNARQLAGICQQVGVHALEAPVSGGRPAAEERRLTPAWSVGHGRSPTAASRFSIRSPSTSSTRAVPARDKPRSCSTTP